MQFPNVVFSKSLDYAIGWTVFHSLWQVTLIAFLVGIALILCRNQTSKTRYWVGNAGLLSALIISIFTFGAYLSKPLDSNISTTAVTVATPALTEPNNAPNTTNANPTKATETKEATSVEPSQRTWQSRIASLSAYANRNLPLIVFLWLAGMVLFILKLLGGLLQVYDLKRRMNFPADPYWSEMLENLAHRAGFKQPVQLLESALVRSPLTIGHLKPVILFPLGIINKMTEQEVEAVLAHELAHIMRKDYIFNILQSFVEAIFYYHPAIWWISAQVRNERENACDDTAIALIENRFHYAKALVAIQEMAMYAQTPALAFAGNHKKQLLGRVQRLISPPKTNFNIMEKAITTVIISCFVFALAFGQQIVGDPRKPSYINDTKDITELNHGKWETQIIGDSVELTVQSIYNDGRWVMSDMFSRAEVKNLSTEKGFTTFEMKRPAGIITFIGTSNGNEAVGEFEFKPDASYRNTMKQNGISDIDDLSMILCFFADFPADYLQQLSKLGYYNLDNERLRQFASLHLNIDAIQRYQKMAAELGQEKLNEEDLILCKVSNATLEYVERLSNDGYKNLSLQEVNQLALHCVNSDYIKSMNNAGFGKLTVQQLLAAKVQQIDARYLQKTYQAAAGKLQFEQILNQKAIIENEIPCSDNNGININFEHLEAEGNYEINDAIRNDVEEMSFEQFMNMNALGIDAQFIADSERLGFGRLGMEEISALKVHNIDAQFVKSANNLGFGKLSFDQVVQVKIHEITPAFVKKVNAFGFKKLSFDRVVEFKIHGIDQAFLENCKALGVGELSVQQVIEAKIHNIKAADANAFRALGLIDINFIDLVNAKLFNVTPEYIRQQREKDVNFNLLGQYNNRKQREMASQRSM